MRAVPMGPALLALACAAAAQDGANTPTASVATAAASAPASAKPEPPRHALVIGHSRYVEVPALPNVANDLTDMCSALERLRFRTRCLADLPDRAAMIEAVSTFVAGVPAGATALFYFGGHAVQVAGENYLIPAQVTAADARGWLPQFVRLSELFQISERANAGFQFIVLDACRDDPEGAQTPPQAAPVPAPPAAPAQQQATRGRETLRSMLRAVRGDNRFAAYGIAAVRDAPRNTLVLFATGAGTTAFDGDGERNGPLTKHLLVQMQRPRLQVDQVLKNIIQAVGDDTEQRYRRRQSPSLYGTFAGEFCFNGCPQVVSAEELDEERRRARAQVEAERQRATAQAERERLERERRERREERKRREGVVVPAL